MTKAPNRYAVGAYLFLLVPEGHEDVVFETIPVFRLRDSPDGMEVQVIEGRSGVGSISHPDEATVASGRDLVDPDIDFLEVEPCFSWKICDAGDVLLAHDQVVAFGTLVWVVVFLDVPVLRFVYCSRTADYYDVVVAEEAEILSLELLHSFHLILFSGVVDPLCHGYLASADSCISPIYKKQATGESGLKMCRRARRPHPRA